MKDFKYYDTNTKIYADDKQAWRTENVNLENEFWSDVLDDLGLSTHPKRNKLIELAKGFSRGESRNTMYQTAVELSELMD